MNKKIAIVGGGNMGGAIAKGLQKGTTIPTKNISICDISEDKLNEFRQISTEWQLATSANEIVEQADIVILAVKPWLIETVANQISKSLDYASQIIISVAAGVEIQKLKNIFDADATIFRIIPNTAIEVLQSVSSIAYENASEEQVRQVTDIFDELGKTFVIQESQLNAMMSLASCGIAYAFRYIRAATEGGVETGIYPNVAKEVVMQTLKGAVALLEAKETHPETEIDKVTTPGGITIKGLNEMEACGFSNAVIKGLKKSTF